MAKKSWAARNAERVSRELHEDNKRIANEIARAAAEDAQRAAAALERMKAKLSK